MVISVIKGVCWNAEGFPGVNFALKHQEQHVLLRDKRQTSAVQYHLDLHYVRARSYRKEVNTPTEDRCSNASATNHERMITQRTGKKIHLISGFLVDVSPVSSVTHKDTNRSRSHEKQQLRECGFANSRIH